MREDDPGGRKPGAMASPPSPGGAEGRGALRGAGPRLPGLPGVRARTRKEHARRVPHGPAPARRVPRGAGSRRDRGVWGRRRLLRPATGKPPQRGGGRAPSSPGDDQPQDGVPALVLPAPSPGGADRRRSEAVGRAAGEEPQAPWVLSHGEVTKLVDSAKGNDPTTCMTGPFLELMYGCGLQASEAVGLELTDIDLRRGFVRRRQGARRSGWCRRERSRGALRAICAWSALSQRSPRAGPVRELPQAADPAGALQDHPAPREGGRARGQDEPAHTLRHTFATHLLGRRRPALGPGDVWLRDVSDDLSSTRTLDRADQRGLLQGASAGGAT